MTRRRTSAAGCTRKKSNRSYGAPIERLEPRFLLSDVSFAAPVFSPLPTGFQFQKFLPGSSPSSLIATSASGGGLWLVTGTTNGSGTNDGTYFVNQNLNTTASILGSEGLVITHNGQNISANAVYTTAGLMIQQTDGTFAPPNGLAFPADAVPGAYAISSFASQSLDLAVERFTPNPSSPGHGTLIAAVFPLQSDGTFGAEIDTTLATDAPDPHGTRFVAANFDANSGTDIAADGMVFDGKGDGTFNTTNPIKLPVDSAAGNYYAVDLNGDFKPDLVLFPSGVSGASSDSAQILLNDGDGTFRVGSTVDLASVGMAGGPLMFGDFTSDNNTDIAAAIVSGGQSPAVAIAPNIDNGTFFSPDVIPTPGFVAQTAVDFNGDGKPDLVGISSNGAGQFSVVSLLNQTFLGSVVRLTVAPNPSVAGQSITLTALATNPDKLDGSSFTFFDGSAQLGQVDASNGAAVFVTNKLSAGTHSLTASLFTGDSSVPVIQTVNAAPPNAPLISVVQLSRKGHDVVVPGGKDNLRLNLTNLGGAAAAGTIAIKLYATAFGTIDANAIPIPIPSLASRSLHLGAKGHATLTGDYTIPENLPAGSYFLAAQVLPLAGILASQLISSTVVDATPLDVEWEFGTVNGRKNVVLVRHLANGQIVTFKLTGAGAGTLTEGGASVSLGSGSPNYEVSVDGTSLHDHLTISQKGGANPNIVALTLKSDLQTCDVRTDTPHSINAGSSVFTGPISTVSRLMLGTVPAASLAGSTVPGQVTIPAQIVALQADSLNGATLMVGDSTDTKPTSARIGSVDAGSRMILASKISSLEVGHAAAGSLISAPSIDKLTSRGDFDGSLAVTGTTKGAQVLGQVSIGGAVTGTSANPARWAVNGNIGKIRIAGNAGNLQILGGAALGPAGELASPPATYSGTLIEAFDAGGSVTASLISAGLDPVDGVLLNGNDRLLGGGAIGDISIKGSASADSRFVAAALPAQVKINSSTIATASDPRFKLA